MKSVTSIINELLADWKLIPVEEDAHTARAALNVYGGINYLLYCENRGEVYGLASLVQYGKNYRTFTVPKDEYAICQGAVRSGAMMPYYTMQAYVNEGKIIGLAMVKTADLLKFIERGLAKENAKFYVCHWDDVRDFGCIVKEYNSVSVCKNEDKPEQEEKKLHEAWHEAYQQYLKEQHDEENCAECDMRGLCMTLESMLGTEK